MQNLSTTYELKHTIRINKLPIIYSKFIHRQSQRLKAKGQADYVKGLCSADPSFVLSSNIESVSQTCWKIPLHLQVSLYYCTTIIHSLASLTIYSIKLESIFTLR